jgi:hypothetical protein
MAMMVKKLAAARAGAETKLAELKAAVVTMMKKGPVRTNSGRRH